MDFRRTETTLKPSNDSILDDQDVISDPELDACITIMNKQHALRTDQEIERFVNKIASLEIFSRSLLENLGAKRMISQLMPFMKPEFIPAGKPIFHYERPAEKMYIILKGKAKEFIPKTIDEIEQESHTKYGGGFQYLQGVAVSASGIQLPETPTSVSSIRGFSKVLDHSSLNTISEEGDEEGGASDLTKKRFRKLKAVLPFLKKINTVKTSVQNADDYRYKKSIKKVRSILKPIFSDEDINLEDLEREFGVHVVNEFKKYPKAYFIGGIVKVKFSKYLTGGAHCGIRALRDNSLRSRGVFAEEDCYCISLSRDDFTNVLESEKALNIDKIEFFKKMFNMFDERTVVEFSLLWENYPCKTTDIIFQQNEPAKYLYVLATGEVMLTKTIVDNPRRKQFFTENLPFRIKKKTTSDEHTMRVATVLPGEFFGGEDFFDEQPRELAATVVSNKVKIYRLAHEKYKNVYKAYSDIVREIKRMTNMKADWKRERLEGLYQHHHKILKERKETREEEQEKNLISLGLISPDSQASSHRLKAKLMEKARISTTISHSELENNLKSDRQSTLQDEINEGGKENISSLANKTTVAFPRRVHLRQTSHGDGRAILKDNSELNLFSRAAVPVKYNPRFEDLLKQDIEVFRLEPKENRATTRPGTSRLDRPGSQSRDSGILSSASIKMLKERFVRKRTSVNTVTGLDIKEIRETQKSHQRVPSIDLDLKPSLELSQNTSSHNNLGVQSLNERMLKQYIIGKSLVTANHRDSLLMTSIDKGSLSSLDTTARQNMKGHNEYGSMSKIEESNVGVRKSSVNNESMHAKSKARASFKILKSTLGRRESCRGTSETSIMNSKDQIEGQKSFKINGEKAVTSRDFPSRKGLRDIRNMKFGATMKINP